MKNRPSTQLWTLSSLLLLHKSPCNSLELQHSWRATSSSQTILAVAQVSIINNKSTENFLATTAGHKDGGAVTLWNLSALRERCQRGSLTDDTNPCEETDMIAVTTGKPHTGSIFALTARREYLLSGSFDRSATLQRFSKGNCVDTYSPHHIGTLTDHTGWVRDVVIVSDNDINDDGDEDDCDDNRFFLLSIGCNFINVWSCSDGESRQLARLDAGPSPGDNTDELFRRHDILCMDVNEGSNSIVAGLVDGTLRAFTGKWDVWREQKNDFDASGSCQMLNDGLDERPFAAIRAHEGRIIGVHAIPGYHDQFISVGYDAYWRRWKLNFLDREFVMLAEGEVGDKSKKEEKIATDERRIRCSVLTPALSGQTSLIVGTKDGRIYAVSNCNGSANANADYKEIWRESCKGVAITALTCMAMDMWDTSQSDGTVFFAGTSNGFVRAFTD